MRIIIVEDEIKIREGMSKLIEVQTNHRIVGEAVNGEEGLEMILRFKPDLVIMDIQMPKMNGLEVLREMHQQKLPSRVVILSGYSEFEYAQKAIQYGVDDYLLKPIGPDDVQGMLGKIEEKIKQDELQYGTPEINFRNLLDDNQEVRILGGEMLCKSCKIPSDGGFDMFAGYLGSAPANYKLELERVIGEQKEKYRQLQIFCFYMENLQKVYIMITTDCEHEELRNRFERFLYTRVIANYRERAERPIWARESYEKISATKKIANLLDERISFALVIYPDGWMTEEAIKNYRSRPFVAPVEIYNRIRNAVCQEDNKKIAETAAEFLDYMKNGEFSCEDIRRAFIKSYYLISDTVQEIDKGQFVLLKNRNIVRNLEAAVTWYELEQAYQDVIQVLITNKVNREDISNYVIKKAINYIREHYQEGITQEEVSRELEITPEYFSTLFNREMGIKFSSFLKQFRISHAKRLLQGTDKKIYEIAKMVGYSDVKYFQRVFKDEIGISPGEYRQMNG